MSLSIGAKIAIGAGVVGAVGVGALVLAACGEKNPNEFAMDEFGKFDTKPKDNQWTANELEKTWIHTRTQEVNTYRIGDYIHGTRQILQSERTESMRRIFEAARGNDAVLSLDELTNFTLQRGDTDGDKVLSGGERRDFNDAYGVTETRTREVLMGQESFMRYAPRQDYPDPSYPSTPTGPTSPGDDHGTPPTSGGDEPSWPSNPTPGPSPTPTPTPSNPGNSTDNGNPDEGDF
jgi:hypothetical protein